MTKHIKRQSNKRKSIVLHLFLLNTYAPIVDTYFVRIIPFNPHRTSVSHKYIGRTENPSMFSVTINLNCIHCIPYSIGSWRFTSKCNVATRQRCQRS